MKDDLEALRSAFAADADRVRATCPAPDELWDGARGGLNPDRLSRLVDHVSDCPACAEAWQIAIEVMNNRDVTTAAHAGVARRPVWWQWGAVAAAAAAIVIAAVVFPRYRAAPPQDVYRTDMTPPIRSLLTDGAAVPRDRVLLRWAPVADGVRYFVEIATEDLTVVDTAENLTTAEHLVPASALAALAPGTKLIWHVQATLPDGRRLRSQAFTLIVQ